MLTLWLAAGVLGRAAEPVEPPAPEPTVSFPGGGWIEHLRRQARRKLEIEQAQAAAEAAQRAAAAKRDEEARAALMALQATAKAAETQARDDSRYRMAEQWLALASRIDAAIDNQRRANMAAVQREMHRLERIARDEAERARLDFEADEDDAIALLLAA